MSPVPYTLATLDQESNISYYHTDHLGTPQELTNTNGEIVWEAEYSTWGNTAKVSYKQVDATIQDEVALQPLRFQGQYYDQETGLHYNRFRYYDPDVGRFTTLDPIGLAGGTNTYQYAPNPMGWIDPLGLACSDQKMVDTLIKHRADNGTSSHGTLAVGRDGNGNLTPVRESIPNYGSHAEPQVLKDLEGKPKPHTVAVDQLPCEKCSPLLKKKKVDKIIVPCNPKNNNMSPKSVAVKASQGKISAVPKIL